MSEVCGKSVKSESVKSFRSGLVFGRNVCYNKNNRSRNAFRARNKIQRILPASPEDEYGLMQQESFLL